MLGFPILYCKGMRPMMFQLSGFCCRPSQANEMISEIPALGLECDTSPATWIRQATELPWWRFRSQGLPKGSQVLLWGILPHIIIVIPNIETLHSTIKVLWTLWVSAGKIPHIRRLLTCSIPRLLWLWSSLVAQWVLWSLLEVYCTIVALSIRKGFWTHYTIHTTRTPPQKKYIQYSIGNSYLSLYIRHLEGWKLVLRKVCYVVEGSWAWRYHTCWHPKDPCTHHIVGTQALKGSLYRYFKA